MAKNELKVVDSFDLQTISGDLAQAVEEEMDGLGSLPFDRVKIPSGGGLAFEVPGEDDENPESATEIIGVILDHHPVNAYWINKFAGGNEQPDCSSFDGKQGVERETGEIKDCASCPYNQFGSDDKGKACKNVHRVFILREGNPVPLVLSLPPTSLKYMRDYIAKRVILKGFRCWQLLILQPFFNWGGGAPRPQVLPLIKGQLLAAPFRHFHKACFVGFWRCRFALAAASGCGVVCVVYVDLAVLLLNKVFHDSGLFFLFRA